MTALPSKLSQVGQAFGLAPTDKTIRFDMWRTSIDSTTVAAGTSLVTAAGSSTIDFPANYDHWISFYDITHKKPIYPIEEVSRWFYEELRDAPAGPTKGIEILGMVSGGSSTWRRRARLRPDVAATVTPSIEMVYWRLPTDLSTATSELDIDYKYAMLGINGPMLELLRPDDPAYERYLTLEKSMLMDLARTGKAT